MKLAESQSKLFEEFSQIIRENRLSHAYLFSGDFGSLDMAIWLAQSRFCVTPENSLPCGHCRPCRLIAQGDFSDVKLVEPQGQIIKTDTIRQLTREFSQSSFEGQAQVFIIRDADKMHVNAANSLLKFIEEPQSQIYIFLLTADEKKKTDYIIAGIFFAMMVLCQPILSLIFCIEVAIAMIYAKFKKKKLMIQKGEYECSD